MVLAPSRMDGRGRQEEEERYEIPMWLLKEKDVMGSLHTTIF